MKKKNLTIISIFIIFLVVPSVIYWFINSKMDQKNYENRNLYKKPNFTFNNITDFPKKYENYFNDHLPFKNEIRKMRSKTLFNLFKISTDERVIVGENNWLFYTGNSTISDYRKTEKYSLKVKKQIKKSLLKTQNKLNEKNIDFYILILPNKETVYTDKLKNKITISPNKDSKIDDLISYLKKNTNLNVIYPKAELITSRKKFETYYKNDTHWNNYGAYIGITKLMVSIDENYHNSEIYVKYANKKSGDLADMNLIPNVENKEPTVKNFYNEINYKCKEINNYEICKSDTALYNKTVLFVGDSFRIATIPYFSKIYKNAIIIHKNDYNEDLIKKYDVDIVIYETVERLSDTLMNTNILYEQK